VEERVSGNVTGTPRRPTGRWSVWKFNWLAHHKMMAEIGRVRHHARGLLLDIGCGARSYEPMFETQVEHYVGVDLASGPYLGAPRPDVYGRCEALPIRAGVADTALAISVMNYLPEPARMVGEAWRVLKPGGVLLAEFTQMRPHDPKLPDYFRYTSEGAAWLLEHAGFEIVESRPIGGLMARVGLSAIGALNRINRGPTRVLTEIPVRLLYVVLQVAFEALDRLLFDPRECLGHLVVARKPKPTG
jgi:SAM-dependent methyltransferase